MADIKTNYKNKDVNGQDFGGLDLSYANFKGADASNCSFINTNLEGANFVDSNMDGADFTGAICYFMNDKNSTGHAIWNNAKCYGMPNFRAKDNTDMSKPRGEDNG